MAVENVDITIHESDGEVDVERNAWFFFGPPKIGKSTLASGWPNCIFLCTSDKEVKRLKVPYILVNTHKKLVAAVDELIDNRRKYKDKYQTIVFDFVDAMYTNCQTAVCKKLGISHQSEAGFGKGVDMIDNEWKKIMNNVIGSPYGCIFISHLTLKDVTVIGGGTRTKAMSTLPDRARRIIIPLVSVIGYIDFEEVKTKDENGKVKYVKKRMISFEASEILEAGDRDGLLPPKIQSFKDPKKTYALIESYYSGEKVK